MTERRKDFRDDCTVELAIRAMELTYDLDESREIVRRVRVWADEWNWVGGQYTMWDELKKILDDNDDVNSTSLEDTKTDLD
ncbi:MAG: hypothetical protein ACWGQW_19220 [bacterium]